MSVPRLVSHLFGANFRPILRRTRGGQTAASNAVFATLAHDPAENLAATPIVGVKDGRIRAISHLAAHGTDEFSIVPWSKALRIHHPCQLAALATACLAGS